MIEFLRPGWLLLAPTVLLVYALWRRRGSGSAWRAVIDAELLPHLLAGRGSRRAAWPWVLLAFAYLAAVVALAGPSLELPERKTMTRLSARVIVLDLSPSMATADISPARLARARYKVRDLLRRPDDVQHALVVFAGDAFTVSPVTADDATLLNLLDALSPEMMPIAGNRVDRGLDLALELLARAGDPDGKILLVTDGVDGTGADAAGQVRRAGATLDVLAVGTADGAPVPAADGGFLKDADGNIVIKGVDLDALSALAAAGGGRALAMTLDESDLDTLAADIGPMTGARTVARDEAVPRRRDVGPYLVLLLVPAALAAFRRGWLLVLVPLLVFPPPGHAFSWQDLWSRPDQQAATDLEAGRFEDAAARGDTPWRGAALYRDGDFAAAAEAFSSAGADADAHYNLGNALARSGNLAAALDAYERALARDPGADDARHNRDLVKQLLQQQQQQAGGGRDGQDGEQADAGASPESGTRGQDDPQPGREQAGGDSATRGAQDGSAAPDSRAGVDPGDDQRADGASASPGREQAGLDDAADHAGDGRDGQRQAADGDAGPGAGRSASGTAAQGERDAAGEQAAGAGVLAAEEEARAQQRLEQWLRQVPDDPEGLLRRKFLHQYRSRQARGG